MSFHLSKSRFTKCVQCPKMLWLSQYKPEEYDDSVMNNAILESGSMIGDLAMGLFGNFTEIPYLDDKSEMARITSDLIDKNERVIAEASFATEDGFCSVDILVNNGNKSVELYEVKSSTHDKDIYHYDIAYQYHILKQCGFEVTKACLVYVNNSYVRLGELNIKELFKIKDLTSVAIELHDEVIERIKHIKEYMKLENEPDRALGEYCSDPYDCGFWNYCTRNLPHPNVFDLSSTTLKTILKHYQSGIISYEEVANKGKFNAKTMLQVNHELNELPPHIDKVAIKSCIDNLYYPIYFLDFESFNSGIPLYDNSKPYSQIVFQYSLHYIEKEGGEVKHKEFLAYPGKDPRRELAEQLCKDIPSNGCVVVFNKTFEQTRIKELAALYPDLSEQLNTINSNIQDLMVPFQKKDYYCRAMQGSYSIKYVLPALFPDDPELDYHNLEGVQNGGQASSAFINMAKMSPEDIETTRAQLLKYCCLDTYALVKVFYKLKEAIK